MLLYWFHARPLNFIIYLIVWRCWVCIGQIIFQLHVVVIENRRRISLQTLPGVEAILHKDIAKIYRLSFHKLYITLSLLLSGNPFWIYKSDWMDQDECMSVKYDSWSRLLMLVQTPTPIYLTSVSVFLDECISVCYWKAWWKASCSSLFQCPVVSNVTLEAILYSSSQ